MGKFEAKESIQQIKEGKRTKKLSSVVEALEVFVEIIVWKRFGICLILICHPHWKSSRSLSKNSTREDNTRKSLQSKALRQQKFTKLLKITKLS